MKKNPKILFVVASHGDEPIGLKVAEKLKNFQNKDKFNYVIANPKALKKNVRFIDADLNRIYPGKPKGNNEEKMASRMLGYIKKKNYDYVIDLHGTVSQTGVFSIITKLNEKTLKLALMFDIKKIVIWPESGESSGSLSTFAKCGIEIESGPKKSTATLKILENTLLNFLNNSKKEINLKKEIKKREFYTVMGKIEKPIKGLKLKDWKKVRNFYPVFVDQYEGIKCYKLKKINIYDYL